MLPAGWARLDAGGLIDALPDVHRLYGEVERRYGRDTHALLLLRIEAERIHDPNHWLLVWCRPGETAPAAMVSADLAIGADAAPVFKVGWIVFPGVRLDHDELRAIARQAGAARIAWESPRDERVIRRLFPRARKHSVIWVEDLFDAGTAGSAERE